MPLSFKLHVRFPWWHHNTSWINRCINYRIIFYRQRNVMSMFSLFHSLPLMCTEITDIRCIQKNCTVLQSYNIRAVLAMFLCLVLTADSLINDLKCMDLSSGPQFHLSLLCKLKRRWCSATLLCIDRNYPQWRHAASSTINWGTINSPFYCMDCS